MATVRKIYIEDQAWQDLKSALTQDAQAVSDHTHPDGSIKLYSDNGVGGHLDTVQIYKKSVEPARH